MTNFAKWFSGKTALITGATSGIGREITCQLFDCGCNVLMCGRDKRAMQSLLDQLKGNKGLLVEPFFTDLSDSKALKELITRVNNYYNIDILVNNAGFGYMGDFTSMSHDKISSMLNVNMSAVINLCEAFIPKMLKRSGTGILNIGSVASFFPVPGLGLYCATKHFIAGFTDSLHQELLSHSIHVTGLYPGETKSNFLKRASDGKLKDWDKALNPQMVAQLALEGLSKNKIRVIPDFTDRIKVFISSLVPVSFILKKAYHDRYKINY